MNDIVRAQRPVRLPVVLSSGEVSSLLSHLRGPVWLMASLMYGGGLRLLECAELRVKDIDFDRNELTIQDGKGGKDRVTVLPSALKDPLVDHLKRVKIQHESDLAAGRGSVALPSALPREISQRGKRVGMAVGISRHPVLPGSRGGRTAAASPARIGASACGHGGGSRRRDIASGRLSLASSFLCDAFAPSRI